MKFKLSSKKMAIGLFFTIISLIIVGSCKKDYQTEDQPSDRETDKLVQWYESRIKISDDNPFSKLRPNWDKIYVKQLGGHNIYEISLANQEKLVVSTNEEKRKLEEVAQNTETRLLIFEEKSSNKILYASYMNVRANDKTNLPDLHYKKVGNFSGTILYYHFSGNLSNGWNYLKGKITEKITAITEQQFNQSQKQLQGDKNTDAMVCTSGFADKYQWQCVGVPGYQNCGFNYVGKEYVTVCAWQEQEAIDHIAPDEGGGYIGPIYVDCNGVAGGTATWSNECNTCIGGTTGLTACPPVADIKKDSLKKYYPCMDKLVLQKLENDTLYSKLIKPFQNIYIPGAGQVSFAGLPKITYNFSSQIWGTNNQYKLGETENTTAANSTIYLNTQAIQNASQLFLQVAAIHETAHAYLTYYIKMGTWGQTIQEGGDFPWALKMANYGVIATGQYMTGNYTDHSIFINHYLNETVNILKSVNGGAYTNQEYIMAAIYGMNNAGTIPPSLATTATGQTYFTNLKNQLNTSYNNILTQNGITPAMINTFYNSNLINVPVNKKLPTNCP